MALGSTLAASGACVELRAIPLDGPLETRLEVDLPLVAEDTTRRVDRRERVLHISRARRHPIVGTIFREGLSALRDQILARDPNALPGATSNHCFFCWYMLTRGLANGANGGGGKVGAWVGTRPNHAGELIALGTSRLPPAAV